MAISSKKQQTEEITRYADMLAAVGTEPRLPIMQLLLSAHPEGLALARENQKKAGVENVCRHSSR